MLEVKHVRITLDEVAPHLKSKLGRHFSGSSVGDLLIGQIRLRLLYKENKEAVKIELQDEVWMRMYKEVCAGLVQDKGRCVSVDVSHSSPAANCVFDVVYEAWNGSDIAEAYHAGWHNAMKCIAEKNEEGDESNGE